MRLLSTLVIIGAAVGIFFVFGRPELDTIKILGAQQAEIEQSLAELQELAKLRDDLLSKYNAVNPLDIERLDKIVPSSIDSGLLIAELESFAQDFNLVLKSVSITDEKEQARAQQRRGAVLIKEAEQPFQKLPLSLQIGGTYSALRDFLKHLETNTRVIDIAAIRFVSGEKDFFEFMIDANTYWTGDIIKLNGTSNTSDNQ